MPVATNIRSTAPKPAPSFIFRLSLFITFFQIRDSVIRSTDSRPQSPFPSAQQAHNFRESRGENVLWNRASGIWNVFGNMPRGMSLKDTLREADASSYWHTT